jgi:hypothetical protein
MTEAVKQYLDYKAISTWDMSDEEDDAYGEKLIAMRKKLTLAELESLRGHISTREFYEGIVPLIDAKTGRSYRDDEAAQSKSAVSAKPFREAAVKAADKSASSNTY